LEAGPPGDQRDVIAAGLVEVTASGRASPIWATASSTTAGVCRLAVGAGQTVQARFICINV
jgi:hypothetical protein